MQKGGFALGMHVHLCLSMQAWCWLNSKTHVL